MHVRSVNARECGLLPDSLKRLDCQARQNMQFTATDYVFALKEISKTRDLEQGKCVHLHVLLSGATPTIMLENVLIDVYGKCGSLHDAYSTFTHMPVCNIFSWTAIITAYAKENKGNEALELYYKMRCESVMPDKFVIVVALKACATVEALEQGNCIYYDALACKIELDCFLCSALVDMYSKCKSIWNARNVFDNMKVRDVVSWNAMISGYAQQGPENDAIVLFEEMQRVGLKGSDITCAFVIKACSFLKDCEYGRQVHAYITRFGLSSSTFVANSLLDMYVKCGSFLDAQDIFMRMPDRDVISWTAVMAGLVQRGMGERAINVYNEVLHCNLVPKGATFVVTLNACAQGGLLKEGKQLHCQLIEMCLPMDSFIGSSLVNMYAKCGSINDASSVFRGMPKRELVSWNAIINGCSQQGHHEKASILFSEMIQAGLEPDGTTFASMLKTSACPQALDRGRRLHAYIVEKALEDDVFIGSTLIDMYANCESMKDASLVVMRIHELDTVVWNTLLTALVQQKFEEDAVSIFESMQCKKVCPNEITFLIILKAYTSLTILEWGRALYNEIVKHGYELSLVIKSAILDFYTNCGSLKDARNLFEKTYPRDLIAWTTMITGYTLQGHVHEALDLFQGMRQEEQPNEITFISALCGCSHSGLLDEACWLFGLMIHFYGLVPIRDHFACIVDLLSRAGLLEIAFLIVCFMPISANDVLLKSLLGVCKVFGNVEVAKQVANEAFSINPESPTTLVQLSNIYAMGGRFDKFSYQTGL